MRPRKIVSACKVYGIRKQNTDNETVRDLKKERQELLNDKLKIDDRNWK
jgi:hypothetical protein